MGHACVLFGPNRVVSPSLVMRVFCLGQVLGKKVLNAFKTRSLGAMATISRQ